MQVWVSWLPHWAGIVVYFISRTISESVKVPMHGAIWSWGRRTDLVGSHQIGSCMYWFWSVRLTDGWWDGDQVVFGFQMGRPGGIRPDGTVCVVSVRLTGSFTPDTVERGWTLPWQTNNFGWNSSNYIDKMSVCGKWKAENIMDKQWSFDEELLLDAYLCAFSQYEGL